jgi:PAS domain S-box-containing protein
MNGSYNPAVVLLSYLVASATSFVALNLAAQMAAVKDHTRVYWLVGGGVALGVGIWATHFIGMLAFHPPVPIGYGAPATLASLGLAILVAGFALHAVDRPHLGLRRLLASGVLMGAGIAAMHYTGMYAIRSCPAIRYDVATVAASVAIAIAASVVALKIAFSLRTEDGSNAVRKRIAGASIMGLAITGMHYTGMAAGTFPAGNDCVEQVSAISDLWLAVTIGLCTVLMLAGTMMMRPHLQSSRAVIRNRFGIRAKLTASYLLVALLIASFAVGVLWIQLQTAEAEAIAEAEGIAGVIADAIGDEPVKYANAAQLIIDAIHMRERRDVFIVDLAHRVVADADPAEVGTEFGRDRNNAIGSAIADGRAHVFVEERGNGGTPFKQLALPLRQKASDLNSPVIGAIVLEYTPIYDALYARARTVAMLVGAIGAAFVFLTAALGLRVASAIASPVDALERGARAIASGQYDSRVEVTSKDEIGSLAMAFNQMADELNVAHQRLVDHQRELEDRVSQRTGELQRAVVAQRETADELRLIAEHMPASLCYVDRDQIIRYHNSRFARQYDLSDTNVDGRTVRDVIGAEAYARVDEPMRQALAGQTVSYERRHVRAAETRDLSSTLAPRVAGDGKVVGFYVMTQDITEQKRGEEALRRSNGELQQINQRLQEAQNQLLQSEKMASIGQLASGVAHEINNPIGYVFSNLGTLDRYLTDIFAVLDCYQSIEGAITDPASRARVDAAKQAADLAYIQGDLPALLAQSREGIGRVTKIVRDLKNFSRSASDEPCQWADVHAGIDSTLNIVANELKYKVVVHKQYGALPQIECRPSQINQVIMNLLVNGAQAISTQGSIWIRTGVEGDGVWLEFEDSGTGIPAENLNRIFDPFFTTKPVGKGTGLGLSLAYGIIKDHGGRIDVESVVGTGTTFRIWLPLRQAHSHSQDSSDVKVPV